MEQEICQSCGMPLGDAGFYGTNADDSRNNDYCIYCYAAGEFVDEIGFEEMVEVCTDMLEQYNPQAAREEITEKARTTLSGLKRWQQM